MSEISSVEDYETWRIGDRESWAKLERAEGRGAGDMSRRTRVLSDAVLGRVAIAGLVGLIASAIALLCM